MNRTLDISYQFRKSELLVQALTHKSFSNEQGMAGEAHNEKLEFLGDAVLDLILSDLLMKRFPLDTEGNLSKKRASLVNEVVLARIALDLKLSEWLRLGKGEILSQGSTKPRLLASAYEAVLGAVFLDSGYEVARNLAEQHFSQVMTEMDPTQDFVLDYKTRLQEVSQAELKATPTYVVTGEQGPSHNPNFEVTLNLLNSSVAKGNGRSKKMAEQDAAKNALENWQNILIQMRGNS